MTYGLFEFFIRDIFAIVLIQRARFPAGLIQVGSRFERDHYGVTKL